jgi:hypothetical protein
VPLGGGVWVPEGFQWNGYEGHEIHAAYENLGLFVEVFGHLESGLETVIAMHFQAHKSLEDDLWFEILAPMSFSAKVEWLPRSARPYLSDRPERDTIPDLCRRLRELNNYRNGLLHGRHLPTAAVSSDGNWADFSVVNRKKGGKVSEVPLDPGTIAARGYAAYQAYGEVITIYKLQAMDLSEKAHGTTDQWAKYLNRYGAPHESPRRR